MAIPVIPASTFDFFISAFIAIVAIINPLSTIGVFLSLTRNESEEGKRKIAFMCSLAAFVVLVFFSLTGFFLFQIYGIGIESFRIAGGILIFAIGMRMLFPPEEGRKLKIGEMGQIWLVPLAIPMTSGPGAITTTVMLSAQAKHPWLEIALWSAIFLGCAINFVVLRYASMIDRKLGPEAISSLIKIMGLIVCAIGVQFVITGLKATFPILS
ncbi:MAG: MarC family protein [Candidatus Micrarchaeota archaeon]|nr:MarC family protein [Candidatus Micrarchaeota archaeon]